VSIADDETPEFQPKRLKPGHTRVKLLISYDGTDFFGWQRQQRHVSVQGTLEEALQKIFREPIHLLGASRTDTGVHAVGQVAHFDAPRDPSQGDLRFALTGLTPPSIVIKQAWITPPDFHAIASSTHKTYRYLVLNRRIPSALRHRYSHWIRFPLDLDFLNEASEQLIGEHDFRSFQTSGTVVKSTVRNVMKAHWTRQDDTLIFEITGNGFLKQMVRNIVGTLIELNMNAQKASKLREILAVLDRRRAGPTAPPQGLYLQRVYYPESLDNKCRKL